MKQVRHDAVKIKFLLGIIPPLMGYVINANDNKVASNEAEYALAA